MEQDKQKSGKMFKGSKGVVIFAVILILDALLTIFGAKGDADLGIQSFYQKQFEVILIPLNYILALLEIFLAISILRLKEWSRKWLIRLMCFFTFIIILEPFLIDQDKMNAAEEKITQEATHPISPEDQKGRAEAIKKMEEKIKTYPPEQQEGMRAFSYRMLKMTPLYIYRILIVLAYLLYLLLYIATIFFFARRKVKEQFAGFMPKKTASPPAEITADETNIEESGEDIVKPLGVKLICFLFIFQSLFYLLHILSSAMISPFQGPGFNPVYEIFIIIIYSLLCFGLWHLRNSARVGIIFISSLKIIFNSVRLFKVPNIQILVVAIIFICLHGAIIYYLLRPEIKDYFGGQRVSIWDS